MDAVLVKLLANNLHCLPNPKGAIKLPHPGTADEKHVDMLPFGRSVGQPIRERVAEGILHLFKQADYHVVTLQQAVELLAQRGYTVTPPREEKA